MAKRKNKNYKSTYNNYWIGVVFVVFCAVVYSLAQSKDDGEMSRLDFIDGQDSLYELCKVIIPEDITDGKTLVYPGFEVFFSTQHHQPYFVSWILTPEHVRAQEVSRSDKFRPDNNVKECAQLSDYRRSGFDRGHIAPSADFKYSAEAQDATFFLTNICPQKTELNTRAWANLEGQCRKWALSDSTIIIISGPILSDYCTQTIGETKVTVPQRFFKVVLAPYATPPRAIGFIMPNSYVEGGVQATVMSVDDVEAVTGYDFFSALPDSIENKIEATANYAKWQIKKPRN